MTGTVVAAEDWHNIISVCCILRIHVCLSDQTTLMSFTQVILADSFTISLAICSFSTLLQSKNPFLVSITEKCQAIRHVSLATGIQFSLMHDR